MLVKASIAAAAVIAAGVSLSSIDYRALYNEMYPVNGLKRDVLGLCTQAEPTFVRALRRDRINCYDSMPDNVEIAIGWVRTSSLLAAIKKSPSAMELAERLLAERRPRFARPPQFTGYLPDPSPAQPCSPPAPKLAGPAARATLAGLDEGLARQIEHADAASLAALGLDRTLGQTTAANDGKSLPLLPLAPPAEAGQAKPGAPVTVDTAAARPNMRDGMGFPVPAADTGGCRSPAA